MYLTRKRKEELKRVRAYRDAINDDLYSIEYKDNSPRAVEIRERIIPKAIEWLNGQLQEYYIFIRGNGYEYCDYMLKKDFVWEKLV